jgi:hypothetical protein
MLPGLFGKADAARCGLSMSKQDRCLFAELRAARDRVDMKRRQGGAR